MPILKPLVTSSSVTGETPVMKSRSMPPPSLPAPAFRGCEEIPVEAASVREPFVGRAAVAREYRVREVVVLVDQHVQPDVVVDGVVEEFVELGVDGVGCQDVSCRLLGEQVRMATERRSDAECAVLLEVVLEGLRGIVEGREIEAQSDVPVTLVGRVRADVRAGEHLLELVPPVAIVVVLQERHPARLAETPGPDEKRVALLFKRAQEARLVHVEPAIDADAPEARLPVRDAWADWWRNGLLDRRSLVVLRHRHWRYYRHRAPNMLHHRARTTGSEWRNRTSSSFSPTTWGSPTSAVSAPRSARRRWMRSARTDSATRRCTTPRAAARRGRALLTGLNPHQAGVGWMTSTLPNSTDAYQGYLNERCVTIAEVLKGAGYRTFLSGKWHVGNAYDPQRPDTWRAGEPGWPTPTQRGFDDFYGTLDGAGSFWNPHSLMDGESFIRPESPDFYYTDAISDNAVRPHRRRPRSPEALLRLRGVHRAALAAARPEDDIARYADAYRCGWDAIRTARHETQRDAGLVDRRWPISPARYGVLAIRCVPLSGLGSAADGRVRGADRPHGSGDRAHRRKVARRQCPRQHADLLPVRQRRLRGIPEGRHRVADAAPLQHAHRRGPADARRQPAASEAGAGGHLHVLRPAVGERLQYAVPALQVVGPRGRHFDALHRPLAGRRRGALHRPRAPSTSPTSCRPAWKSPARPTPKASATMPFSRWRE